MSATTIRRLPLQAVTGADITEETDPTPAASVVISTADGTRKSTISNLSKAFRAEPMTQAEIDALSAAENAGRIVLNTDAGSIQACNGSGWVNLG